MKTLKQWLDEYSASHLNPINKRVHWVCVPTIVFSIWCALSAIPLGNALINPASVVALLAMTYYVFISWRLAIGIAFAFVVMYAGVSSLHAMMGPYIVVAAAAIFVAAWIGQFIGHHIEGAKPSFFKDLQFLMIGPLWLLADVYRRLGIPTGGEPPARGVAAAS